MLDWIYANAKRLKEAAFSISGLAVATSTATSLASSVTSWIANLIAVVGGGVYSSCKNMETVDSIVASEREIQLIANRLSLSAYHSEDESQSFEAILKQIVPLGTDTGDILSAIHYVERDLTKPTPDSRWYANFNFIAQMLLSFTTIIVNTIANLEQSEEQRQDPSTAKNALNITVVSICVLLQYLLHTAYVAKNLRQMATKTETLESTLSKIQDSLLFQAYEFNAYKQRKNEVELALRECNENIRTSTSVLADYERSLYQKEGIYNESAGGVFQEEQARDDLRLEIEVLRETIYKKTIFLKEQQNMFNKLTADSQRLADDEGKFFRVQADIEKVSSLINLRN